ncbi:hypothetical protein Tsubulata_050352 [Turnera subulata]|uniref:Uncharacterized protein n=1 Tax=Turnera subulata TaxID=218843 RepID=A0A9Q0FEL3_9ROSI|nr:hypothetical protein Tsubulata_050352 [Turnera subulata]
MESPEEKLRELLMEMSMGERQLSQAAQDEVERTIDEVKKSLFGCVQDMVDRNEARKGPRRIVRAWSLGCTQGSRASIQAPVRVFADESSRNVELKNVAEENIPQVRMVPRLDDDDYGIFDAAIVVIASPLREHLSTNKPLWGGSVQPLLWGGSVDTIICGLIDKTEVRDSEEKSRLQGLQEHLRTNKPSLEQLKKLRELLTESQSMSYFEQQLIQAALDEVEEKEKNIIIKYIRSIDKAKEMAEKRIARPSEPFKVEAALLEFAEKQQEVSPGRRVKFDWKQKANRSSFKSGPGECSTASQGRSQRLGKHYAYNGVQNNHEQMNGGHVAVDVDVLSGQSAANLGSGQGTHPTNSTPKEDDTLSRVADLAKTNLGLVVAPVLGVINAPATSSASGVPSVQVLTVCICTLSAVFSCLCFRLSHRFPSAAIWFGDIGSFLLFIAFFLMVGIYIPSKV